MSIKPQYSSKIADGTKKYEFRKKIAAREIDEIVIYSSSPEKKVIGTVKVKSIIVDTPDNIWKKTHKYAGISSDAFKEYFENSPIAYAYVLGKVRKFKKGKSLSDYGVEKAPQSFLYLD